MIGIANISILILYTLFFILWWGLQVRAVILATRLRRLIISRPAILGSTATYSELHFESPHGVPPVAHKDPSSYQTPSS